MRLSRLGLGAAALSLLAPLAVTSSPAGASTTHAAAASSAVSSAPEDRKSGSGSTGRTGAKKNSWTPPNGVLFSDPMIKGQNRNILARVIRAARNTAKGEYIRVVVWNYDDRPVTNALLDADRRGVHVQVVVAASVENSNWRRTRAQLNRNRRDQSFAVKCKGACRSQAKIMHSKYILFSRVHRAKNISMFGSFNLTTPAGNRQWNDMTTTRNFGVYKSLTQTFREYAKDKIIPQAYQVTKRGKYKITLWPSKGRNTIRAELKKVRCKGATGGAGNNGRTVVRIAIAGWFDAFGNDIARRVRTLWDQGCDVKIITTLAGRGVNRTLRDPRGRGAVPIRKVTYDSNQDGVPERYLHMKNVAISGVFGKDRKANVVITGSPNWSSRAQRSDEILIRTMKSRKLTRQYIANTDRLFAGPWSHMRTAPSRKTATGGTAAKGGVPNLRTGENVPEWFELN